MALMEYYCMPADFNVQILEEDELFDDHAQLWDELSEMLGGDVRPRAFLCCFYNFLTRVFLLSFFQAFFIFFVICFFVLCCVVLFFFVLFSHVIVKKKKCVRTRYQACFFSLSFSCFPGIFNVVTRLSKDVSATSDTVRSPKFMREIFVSFRVCSVFVDNMKACRRLSVQQENRSAPKRNAQNLP